MDREQIRRDPMTDNSEAVMHEKTPYYRQVHNKPLEGYNPAPSEKETHGDTRELFSMQNSYNQLAVGTDKKGDMMVTGSAIRRHNDNTLEREAKQVEGSRRKQHPSRFGEFFTNPAKPDESAFAYRVERRMPEKRVLRMLYENARKHDMETHNDIMPFMDVQKEEETLSEMRQKDVTESEKMAQEKKVRDEKDQEKRFLKNLKFARKKLNSTEWEELRKELFGEAEIPEPVFVSASSGTDSPEDGTEEDLSGEDTEDTVLPDDTTEENKAVHRDI